MRNLFLLLKIHFDEELRVSVFLHEKNPLKKMGFVLKNLVLFCMMVAIVSISSRLGCQMVASGLGEAIPVIGYVIGSLVTLVATILKINEILAGKSDAEYLMSLPMGTFLHVICIFLRLSVWNTVLVARVHIPMILAYRDGGLASPDFWTSWMIGLFLTCLPVTGIAALVGTVLALCLVTLRKSNLVQSIIIFGVLAIAGFLLLNMLYSAGNVLQNAGNVQDVIGAITTNFKVGRFYQKGVIMHSAGTFFLFIVYSCVWFLLFLFLLSMSYQEVILALRAPKSFAEYNFGVQMQSDVKTAIARRTWDQWLQSRSYMASTMIGPLYAVLISGFLFLTKGSGLREVLTNTGVSSYFAIPMFLCMLIGMGCNTYCGLSMEGKRLWVMETIPVDLREICKQKIIMNLWITEPVAIICGVMLSITFRTSVMLSLCYVLLPAVYAVASAIWGMWIDTRHADYSMDTESQVLRQSISFYLGWLPGVLLPLLLGVAMLL